MCERGSAACSDVQMFRGSDVQVGRMAGENAIRLPCGSQWGTGRCTSAKQVAGRCECSLVL
jgi:hypothetical protein